MIQFIAALNRRKLSAAIQCVSSSGKVSGCDISGPGLDARGIVVDKQSSVDIDTCNIHDTWNSGIWARGGSACSISESSVVRCGGYGALYSTNGATLRVREVINNLFT